MLALAALASLVGAAAAVGDARTFAVLHHYGKGPLMEGRVDPIVSPGKVATHVHTVMGASNFGPSATGETLRQSNCTTALVKEDKSAYWFPKLYFQDPQNGTFQPVPMFYMNVYYFFEATNDKVKAFPIGLKMMSGDTLVRDPPNHNGTLNLDPSQGTIQPTQWTCPRSGFDPPSWPAGSDGTKAGIQDPNNKGSGIGLPFAECDGYASPLRMDLHFPSCYNPEAGLEDYEQNMAFPSDAGGGKQDCPSGWTHTPHIFFEVYWNTPLFQGRWTPNSGGQPFVLAEGDRTGYSAHGDFIAGWDETVLQQIIDNCNAGDSGMDKCPGLLGGLNDPSTSCNIADPFDEVIDGWLEKLPGDNPVTGWGAGTDPDSSSSTSPEAASSSSSSTDPSTSTSSTSPSTTSTSSSSSSTTSTSSSSSSTTTTTTTTSSSTTTTIGTSSSSSTGTSSSSSTGTSPSSSTGTSSATSSSAAAETSTAGDVRADDPQPASSTAPTTTTTQSGTTVAVTTSTVLPDGSGGMITVWDTVTAWETVTDYATQTAAPARPRRDAHNHALRHGRRGFAARRR